MPDVRGDLMRRLKPRRPNCISRSPKPNPSVFSRIRHDRSESPKNRLGDKGRKKGGVFKRLGDKGRNVFAHSESRYQSSQSRRMELTPMRRYHKGTTSRRTEPLSESEDNGGGHWMSRSKRQKASIEEDDLSQQWVCEETDSFTPRIRYFDFPKKTQMPSNVKTYDGSDDPEGGTLGNANMVPHI
ncbi:hypothetical protein Tco_1000470 [Tanacetum coccineum]